MRLDTQMTLRGRVRSGWNRITSGLSSFGNSITGNLLITALAVFAVGLVVIYTSDNLANFFLGTDELVAREMIVGALFNAILIVAYVGLVLTNQGQLSNMESQLNILQAEHDTDLRCRLREYDEDKVTAVFRNRGPGRAFNPTLQTNVRIADSDHESVSCPVSTFDEPVENRIVEPGETVRRTFDVLLPTEDGVAPFSDAMESYPDDGPTSFTIKSIHDSALETEEPRTRAQLKLDPGTSKTLEEMQKES